MLVVVLGCKSNPDKIISSNKKTDSVKLKASFYPSFIPRSELLIYQKDSGYIISLNANHNLQKESYRDSCYTISFIEERKFDSIDYNYIRNNFSRFDPFKEDYNDTGFDGIGVEINYPFKNIRDTIGFWSPRRKKNPLLYKEIIDPLFFVMNKYFKEEIEMVYIEHLEEYFNMGLPFKKISDNPLKYRLYGTILYDNKIALSNFMDSLPTDKSIIINASNFSGIEQNLQSEFLELINQHPHIIWVADSISKLELVKIGINKKSIISNEKEAI